VNLALINIVSFQLGWFACVFGAARGFPWFGPAVVVLSLALHLGLARDRIGEMRLFVLAGMVGFLLDSAQAAAGTFSFASAEAVAGRNSPWLSPPWMVALWPNFATTLHTSLRWLAGRYWLAALLGAVGGPLSYYAGARLGALAFPEEVETSLLVLGLVWAIAMPILLKLAEKK
jgi:hypothetical protein